MAKPTPTTERAAATQPRIEDCGKTLREKISPKFENNSFVRDHIALWLKYTPITCQAASAARDRCQTWIRTKINGFRVRCPTIRRSGKVRRTGVRRTLTIL